MKLQELISASARDNNDVINQLKAHRLTPLPDVDAARKALDPKRHDINDPIIRPDKVIKVDGDNVNGLNGSVRIEKVARVAVALQRLIVNRTVSFVFGNEPNYNATIDTENKKIINNALRKILYGVKSKSFNRKVARSIFAYKECAEYWYPVEKPNKKYGFNSKYKLRCALFSPMNGDELYPYFDETGDMIAFSRSFSRSIGGVKTTYFETFTDEEHWLWVQGENGMEVVEGYPKKISIGKIPVIYGKQDFFETEFVNALIDRLEKLLSNFADTNDYHASPKIFVTGQINGWSKKGDSGAVIEGDPGATMTYVSWQSAPESVKLEIETLLKLIYTITQTPDISFDAVKGLGAISGVALKLLFMDAHLKVQDKCEIFDDYLQRRVNVILAYIGQLNTQLAADCEEIEIEPEIVPYIITNEIEDLNYWLTANGNKPVISQEESVENAGLSKNPQFTMEKIKEEADAENSFMIGEPIDA